MFHFYVIQFSEAWHADKIHWSASAVFNWISAKEIKLIQNCCVLWSHVLVVLERDRCVEERCKMDTILSQGCPKPCQLLIFRMSSWTLVRCRWWKLWEMGGTENYTPAGVRLKHSRHPAAACIIESISVLDIMRNFFTERMTRHWN